MIKHEDDRRVLYDWANGDFKSIKTIVTKKRTEVGGHSHLYKEEIFFLIQGEIIIKTVGPITEYNVKPPAVIEVLRGFYHQFLCEKDTILICASTEMYDSKDDIK